MSSYKQYYPKSVFTAPDAGFRNFHTVAGTDCKTKEAASSSHASVIFLRLKSETYEHSLFSCLLYKKVVVTPIKCKVQGHKEFEFDSLYKLANFPPQQRAVPTP